MERTQAPAVKDANDFMIQWWNRAAPSIPSEVVMDKFMSKQKFTQHQKVLDTGNNAAHMPRQLATHTLPLSLRSALSAGPVRNGTHLLPMPIMMGAPGVPQQRIPVVGTQSPKQVSHEPTSYDRKDPTAATCPCFQAAPLHIHAPRRALSDSPPNAPRQSDHPARRTIHMRRAPAHTRPTHHAGLPANRAIATHTGTLADIVRVAIGRVRVIEIEFRMRFRQSTPCLLRAMAT